MLLSGTNLCPHPLATQGDDPPFTEEKRSGSFVAGHRCSKSRPKFIYWGEGGALEECAKIGVQLHSASSTGHSGGRDCGAQGSPGRPPNEGGEAGAGPGRAAGRAAEESGVAGR